jgi:hypothetical protein
MNMNGTRERIRSPWLYHNRWCDLDAYLYAADRMNHIGLSSKQQGLGLSVLHRFIRQCCIETSSTPETLNISNLHMVSFDTAVQAWHKLCLCTHWSPSYMARIRTLLSRTLDALDQPHLAFAINRNRLQQTKWKYKESA